MDNDGSFLVPIGFGVTIKAKAFSESTPK